MIVLTGKMLNKQLLKLLFTAYHKDQVHFLSAYQQHCQIYFDEYDCYTIKRPKKITLDSELERTQPLWYKKIKK